MNNTLLKIVTLLVVIFPISISGQSLSIDWFPAQDLEYQSYSDNFVQSKDGSVYRIYAVSGGMGLLAPLHFRISRLNEDFKEVASVKIDQNEIGPHSTLFSLIIGEESIKAIAFHYDEATKNLVFQCAYFDAKDLTQTRAFQPFKTVSNVSWNSHQPTFYPFQSATSPNGRYIAFQFLPEQPNLNPGITSLLKDQNSASIVNSIFVLDESLDTIYENESEGSYSLGDITDEGIIHLFRRNDWKDLFTTIDAETRESTAVQMDSASNFFNFVKDQDDTTYGYTIFKSEEDEITYQIYCPEVMGAPITASIPIEKSILFGKKYNRKKSFMMMMSQELLDIHHTEEGNFIVTTEMSGSSTSTDMQTNIHSTTYSHGNIIAFCFDSDGVVLWITCIPKDHEESSSERGSAVVFRTSNGLHLLYNEGVKNLALGELEKPKNYRLNSAGKTVIAHAIISNEGELSRTIIQDLSDSRMLLSVRDSKMVSDDLVILNMRRKRKEQLGIIKLE